MPPALVVTILISQGDGTVVNKTRAFGAFQARLACAGCLIAGASHPTGSDGEHRHFCKRVYAHLEAAGIPALVLRVPPGSSPYCTAPGAVLASARFDWAAPVSGVLTKSRSSIISNGLRLNQALRLAGLISPHGTSATVAGQDQVSGVAGRYATALFELALEANAVDPVLADLRQFNTLLAENPDLMRLVRSPVFGAEAQSKALAAVLDKAEIGGIAGQFLKVVAANRRLFAVRDLIKAYAALVARHKGEVTAQVTVADSLSDKYRSEIESTLNTVTGKTVRVDVKVDPSIIGGLVVKLGSRMVDSSLRSKLNALKLAMKEVG